MVANDSESGYVMELYKIGWNVMAMCDPEHYFNLPYTKGSSERHDEICLLTIWYAQEGKKRKKGRETIVSIECLVFYEYILKMEP